MAKPGQAPAENVGGGDPKAAIDKQRAAGMCWGDLPKPLAPKNGPKDV